MIVIVASIALVVSVVTAVANFWWNRHVYVSDAPKLITEELTPSELGLTHHSTAMLIRNQGRRDVEGIGIRVRKGNRQRFLAFAQLVAESGPVYKVVLPAGGAECVMLQPGRWALNLHCTFAALTGATVTLVTGAGDIKFELPKRFIEAVNSELPAALENPIQYEERCNQQVLEDMMRTPQGVATMVRNLQNTFGLPPTESSLPPATSANGKPY